MFNCCCIVFGPDVVVVFLFFPGVGGGPGDGERDGKYE